MGERKEGLPVRVAEILVRMRGARASIPTVQRSLPGKWRLAGQFGFTSTSTGGDRPSIDKHHKHSRKQTTAHLTRGGKPPQLIQHAPLCPAPARRAINPQASTSLLPISLPALLKTYAEEIVRRDWIISF